MDDDRQDVDAAMEVRHGRKQDWSIFYNVFIDQRCRELEYLEISVYMVLCRFANSDAEAWPSYSKIAELLGADRQSVMKAIRQLEEKKFISIESRSRTNGSKSSNLYTILELEGGRDNLPGVVGTTYQGGRDNGGSRRRPIEEDQLKRTQSANGVADRLLPLRGFLPGGTLPETESGRIERFVKKLYTALAERRRITYPPSLIQWAASVNDFLKKTTVTTEELERELDWYVNHIGEDFIPKSYSAQTFCDKFIDIQDARKRSEREVESEDDPPKIDIPVIREVYEETSMEDKLNFARNM
jgi:GntR family transcriptional regulator